MGKTMKLAGGSLEVSRIALGCMHLSELSQKDADAHIHAALESGINFFDHADIYAGGKAEEVFGQALRNNPGLRDKLLIQSKCGICKGYFDFSKEHILEAVEGSLKRLGVEALDVLLLHRPDALVEPEEVAEAFDALQSRGMVQHFGVSNQNPMQIKLLQKYVKQPLLFNQLQLSVMFTGMIDAGLNVNMKNDASVVHDGSILDFCRLEGITIQPWSPFQYGMFEGIFLGNPKFPELNRVIDEIAARYGVTNNAVAAAWLLRHPGGMQPIIGTTNTGRLRETAKAMDICLTRQEWYEIYRAAGNTLP